MSTAPALRLVTWNIHKGIGGVDRRYRPERIVEVLHHARPDLVLLQEVDEGVPRSRGDRQVDLLGDALGLEHRAYHPNVRLRRGHYGNAVLSRLPLHHAENLDLTRPFKKRRAALHARLTLPADGGHRTLWLFDLHLGLAEYERRQQVRRVLDYLAHHHPAATTAVLVGGDFNDVWVSLGPLLLAPAGFRSVPRPAPTFPAWRPLRPLDRLWVRGPAQLERCHPIRSPLARQASDHLPVAAELRFDE